MEHQGSSHGVHVATSTTGTAVAAASRVQSARTGNQLSFTPVKSQKNSPTSTPHMLKEFTTALASSASALE